MINQIPLYYWNPMTKQGFANFGDALSEKIVERMAGHHVVIAKAPFLGQKKFLAIGSIMHFAENSESPPVC